MANIRLCAFADEADGALKGQIEALGRNGIGLIELRNVDGTNVSDLTAAQAKETGKILAAAGITVWSVGSPIGKVPVAEAVGTAHLDKFRRTLETAQILGAENIRLFSFYIPADAAPENFRSAVLEGMGTLLEIAKGSGVDLCHENEKGIYGDNAERCVELLAAFPELKGIFDPANFIQCGVDPKTAWPMLKNRIKYLHIKDATPDGGVVPAGMGVGDVPAIVKEFSAMGGGVATLEPHLKVFDGLASLEQEGARSGVGGKFVYESNNAAFDAAAAALKALL